MKKTFIITMMLALMFIFPIVVADDMDLNVSTSNDLSADIDLYAEGDMTVDVGIHTTGDVTYNTSYNNHQYYDNSGQTHVTRKTTNSDGIFRTIIDLFQMYFGEKNTKEVNRYEAESLNYLEQFRQSIVDEIYYKQVQPMRLEMMAQRKINEKLTLELDAIHNQFGWNVSEHGLQCYGYLRVMLEEETGVSSVTCEEGNETQKWHKQIDSAVMIRPIYHSPVNETNSSICVDENCSNLVVNHEFQQKLNTTTELGINESTVCTDNNCSVKYDSDSINLSVTTTNLNGTVSVNVTG